MKIAALDIGGTAIKYCLYDTRFPFENKIVRETPTDAVRGGEAVLQRAEEFLASMGDFDAAAVSTAGQIDPRSGSVIYATDNIPGYTGMQIGERLRRRFRVPVLVENDVNAAALGEAAFGAGRGYPDFLCLTYGTGIGGAILIDHKIYYGSSFSAGEMGHIVTHAGGLPCTCGSRGCYEAYASTTALVRMVKERCNRELNGRQIFAGMQDDPNLESTVIAWIREVMWGLVSLIHIFNPPCIVLGGGIMNEPLIQSYIQQNIGQFVMKSYRNVEIRKASLGNTAGLQGVIHAVQSLTEKDEKTV